MPYSSGEPYRPICGLERSEGVDDAQIGIPDCAGLKPGWQGILNGENICRAECFDDSRCHQRYRARRCDKPGNDAGRLAAARAHSVCRRAELLGAVLQQHAQLRQKLTASPPTSKLKFT